MAFRSDEHFRDVRLSGEYQEHLSRWVANADLLPGESREDVRKQAIAKGSEFNALYGRAFFGERGAMKGRPLDPMSTDNSKEAFLTLLWAEGEIDDPTEEAYDEKFYDTE